MCATTPTISMQSLYVTFRTGFKNPSKLELINMMSIINKTQLNSRVYVNYIVVDPVERLQTNTIHGKIPNMRLMNSLASTEYRESRIDIRSMLNDLEARHKN